MTIDCLNAPYPHKGRRSAHRWWLLPTLLALLMPVTPAVADVRLVTSAADGGPGSLRQTIAEADEGDTVAFALPLPATITLTSGQLLVSRSLTLRGPGPNLLTISGNNASRVIEITGGAVELSGMTITDGKGDTDWRRDSDGGGLLADAGTEVFLTHCAFRGNLAEHSGGGIANMGDMVIRDSIIIDNEALNSGGGLLNDMDANLTMLRCLVSDNRCGEVYEASGAGGGIMGGLGGHPGLLSLTDCVVTHNHAASGGGLFQEGDTTVLTRCVFAANTATMVAGGIKHFYCVTDLYRNPINSTMRDTIVEANSSSLDADILGQCGFHSLGGNTIGVGDWGGFRDGDCAGDETGTAAAPLTASARLFPAITGLPRRSDPLLAASFLPPATGFQPQVWALTPGEGAAMLFERMASRQAGRSTNTRSARAGATAGKGPKWRTL